MVATCNFISIETLQLQAVSISIVGHKLQTTFSRKQMCSWLADWPTIGPTLTPCARRCSASSSLFSSETSVAREDTEPWGHRKPAVRHQQQTRPRLSDSNTVLYSTYTSSTRTERHTRTNYPDASSPAKTSLAGLGSTHRIFVISTSNNPIIDTI